MAYCTQADLERVAGGADRLIELTDRNEDGAVDAQVVADAISDASRLVDSYLQRRYSVPLADPSDIIRQVTAREAVHSLRADRQALTDDDRDRHQERMEWLRSVADGAVVPGVDPPPTKSTSVRPAAGDRSSVAGAITRSSLEGFS